MGPYRRAGFYSFVMSIVCLGELIVDRYREGAAPSCFAGGSAANVAIGLKRQGVPVALWTRVGADAYGGALREACQKEGLPIDSITVDPEHPTRIANIRLDPAGEPSFEIENRDSADQYLAITDIDVEALRSSRLVHISGTTLLGAKTFETLQSLLAIAREQGIFVSFDPNVRIARESTAWKRLQEILPLVDMLKVGSNFLGQAWPGMGVAQVREELGLRLLIVTSGAGGAQLVTDGMDLQIPAQPALVVDATGAGDAWTASFLGALVRRIDTPLDVNALRAWAEAAAYRAARACEHVSATEIRLAHQA